MYFLGQASNYRFRDVLRHTFSFGTRSNLNELRAYLAAHYGTTKDRVALYHTGRTALAIALEKLVEEGSEVIVTSLTCYAVYEAVSEVGCTPVFADIDPETLHFGVKELKLALVRHPDASAVVVQNNLGHPCDIKGIEKICRQYGLVLIEDLAHSAGMHYTDGREAGTVGDAAILSFGKGKAIDTISGGAVVFTGEDAPTVGQPERRPRLSDRLRDRWYPFFGLLIRGFYHLGSLGRLFTSLLLKIHFIERSADADLDPGDRLTYWQAKLALKQMKKFPRSGKKPIRDFYFVRNRAEVLRKLGSAGFIFDDIWYSCPVAPERYYKRLNFPEEECKKAVWAAEHLVNVPTWYSKKALRPALNLIERFEAKFGEKSLKKATKKPLKESSPSKPREVRQPERTELDFAISELSGDYSDDPEEYDEPKEKYNEPVEYDGPKGNYNEPAEYEIEEDSNIPDEPAISGTINYSELVEDKFDHLHLNRTNIIDKNVNSDGTSVTPTKEERMPKKEPIKNNLPKIRQYKKPERDPETTEGKVW